MAKDIDAALYAAVSVIVALSGVVVIGFARGSQVALSIGTSLLAGGVASVAFTIIRHVDWKNSRGAAGVLEGQLKSLSADIAHFDEQLGSLQNVVYATSVPKSRRVFDRHPTEEVAGAIAHRRRTSRLELDTMGLSLRPFVDDNLEYLRERSNVVLRLLVQEPGGKVFQKLCEQEARSEQAMREDILIVTRRILELVPAGGLDITVKWAGFFPSISLVRVERCMFVRARFLNEASQPPMFFERYLEMDGDEGRCFKAYHHYFEQAWRASRFPTVGDCEKYEDVASR